MNAHSEDEVNAVLSELRGPVPLATSDELAAQRMRLLPGVRQHVRGVPVRRRRARRIRQASFVTGAAGLVLSAVVFIRSDLGQDWFSPQAALAAQLKLEPLEGELTLSVSNEHRALRSKTTVAAKGVLESNGVGAVTTSHGVHVAMADQTRIGLDGLNTSNKAELRLLGGEVFCSVPPLGTERRFSVVTGNARVIVHGTRFSVSTEGDSTCVRVTEGKVEVLDKDGQRFLTVGQQWGCDATPTEPEVAEAPPAEVAPEPVRPVKKRPSSSSRPSGPSPEAVGTETVGTLADESELLSQALSAERRGQSSRARILYSRLLRTYPESPLAPAARQGLRRLH